MPCRHSLAQGKCAASGISPGVAAQRCGAAHPQEKVDAATVDCCEESFIVMSEQEVCAGSEIMPDLDEIIENLARLRTSVDVVAEEYHGSCLTSCLFNDLGQGFQKPVDIADERDPVVHSVTLGSSS